MNLNFVLIVPGLRAVMKKLFYAVSSNEAPNMKYLDKFYLVLPSIVRFCTSKLTHILSIEGPDQHV